MSKKYLVLAKPGIILGNIITTVGGFALASRGNWNFSLFLITLLGLACVIASACVCNNYIDRHVDAKMKRTQQRALARGVIAPWKALIFAAVLGILGAWILAVGTNALTVTIALLGFFVYVGLYTPLKYCTTYGTLIGSIAGGAPPLVGYCAVTNQFDQGALLLYLTLVLWQMPHFYAIAMYHFDEYASVAIPVLPVIHGNHVTKIHMLLYILAFFVPTLLLTYLGYTGYLYAFVVVLLASSWLWLCIRGFKASNDKQWARHMFRASLVVITVISIMISVNVSQGL